MALSNVRYIVFKIANSDASEVRACASGQPTWKEMGLEMGAVSVRRESEMVMTGCERTCGIVC